MYKINKSTKFLNYTLFYLIIVSIIDLLQIYVDALLILKSQCKLHIIFLC